MLGKLIKHEFKATYRIFLPLYCALLILCVFVRFLYSNPVQRFTSSGHWLLVLLPILVAILYALLMAVVFFVTLVVMSQRFSKNLLGDEGYLMYTLPVPSWQHVTSKSLVAGIWMFASCAIAVSSIVVIQLQFSTLSAFWRDFWAAMGYIAKDFEISTPLFAIELLILCVLFAFSAILPFFAAISLGQLWRQHRVLGAILSYVGFIIAQQIITALIYQGVYYALRMDNYPAVDGAGHIMLLLTIALAVLFGAGYFLLANGLLSKKLNLE